MKLLNILKYPHVGLTSIAKPVEKINYEIKLLINKMFLTMIANKGIGLAATQVGILLQIIVMIDLEKKNKKIALINPSIIKKTNEIVITKEGCLSIPQHYAYIKRSKKILVKGLNESGNEIQIQAENTLSVCIQHEIDHLNGLLFLDRLSPLKKNILEKKIHKLQKIINEKKRNR
ncbi:Peptide deformylase [Buchnera aphidicola (Thelaxes suberi)]|uniref:peptide deformylase n=1 Tax=Buchnera aphidicola TaxID=9 RepID=UPI003463A2A3